MGSHRGSKTGGRDEFCSVGDCLPSYAVRISVRARRARLVMSAAGGLEIVVPQGFDTARIPKLIHGRRDWIARAAQRVEKERRRLREEPPRLPDRIVLSALGETWEVQYRSNEACSAGAVRRAVARESAGGRLTVTGDLGDAQACKEALCRWLRRKARESLGLWLAEISGRHGFEYGRVTVRLQRSRWASCSPRKAISLNARLLFLAPEIVDHVLLHELCHTVEMNHSPRFWILLESHDPEYRAHRRLLRAAGTSVPTWLDHGPSGRQV